MIIWGTGFEVSHPPIGRRVQNAQGQRLSELWQSSSPEAFLGTSIQHLPNAFLVLGPNILVYDSFIGIAEAQLDYIVSGLLQMKAKGLKRIEIKPDVLKYHNAKVQTHVEKTVFNRGWLSKLLSGPEWSQLCRLAVVTGRVKATFTAPRSGALSGGLTYFCAEYWY